MFNLISSSPLSDVLAPPISSLDEFIFQWNSFSSFFKQNKDANIQNLKTHIDSTNLPNKLTKMADIIVTEQLDLIKRKKDSFYLSATMEYVLENNLLETLSLVAQADTPTGICPHILLFITRILNDSKVILIPHKSVHTALNKLIVICGKIQAGPYEATEIYFLISLIKLIQKNPDFLNFFSNNSFPLINSLLSLLYSEDSEISKQAGDSIIRLLKNMDEDAMKIIVEETPFCCKIINQIITHFNSIPHSLKPEEIEITNNAILTNSETQTFSISIRKFLCFLKWYIFFDMLINILPEESILTSNLLNEFKVNFLESSLLPDLSGGGFENEFAAIDNILLATILISTCLRNTESSAVFDLICRFLIIPDNSDGTLPNKYKNHQLQAILFKRCHLPNIINVNEQDKKMKFIKLSSATLQLFEDILSRPSLEIVNNLIIRHLFERNYLMVGPKDMNSQIEKHNVFSKFNSMVVLDQMHSVANEIYNLPNINLSSHIEFNHLNEVLYLFISLIPDELKFDLQYERAEYEAYLQEAVKAFYIFMSNCFKKWKASQIINFSEIEGDPDMEGTFIKIIFDNLSLLFELPYEINLQMFSILAKISLIPNEFINEYLLDPTIYLKEDGSSLFTILHKLIEDLQIYVKGICQLHDQLGKTKSKLLGEEKVNCEQLLKEDERTIKILQSLIVLQEFCKKLSSIIYVKNYVLKICKEKSKN